jgi:DNA mismatch endonuclease (patch repair protein)
MPDVFTKRKRSEVMSRIRGRGNKDTEIALAKLLRANHITGWRKQQAVQLNVERWTLNVSRSGARVRPDFTFPKQRVVVFVDGCFWHGCPIHSSPARWLRKSSMTDAPLRGLRALRGERSSVRIGPSTSLGSASLTAGRTGKAFWAGKMAGNIARDKFVTRKLRRAGWRVIRLWEHDIAKSPARCLHRIRKALRNT